ncbi:MAG: hypothetical protein JNL72_13305 [Flavipsychrobacter sp.]|nr:hypothetical protein [Flavipsychrobacter sp.]
MELAKKFTSTDYNKLDFSKAETWDKTINVLQNRLNERYIEPADKLIEFEAGIPFPDRKFGFTILAIDCLLIETLQSFYEGKTNSKNISRDLFTDFLMKRDSFKSYFPTIAEAEFFYYNFRCGILHQAQTFSNTKVRAIGSLVSKNNGMTIVNRIRFHEAVKKEVEEYILLLKNGTNNQLRKNFKIKMCKLPFNS